MRIRFRPSVPLGILLSLTAGQAWAQDGTAAPLELLREGSYDEAIEALDDLRRARPGAINYRWYARALAEVGRYDDALEVLAEAPAELELELANVHGELLYATGDLDGARERFTWAWEGGASDRYPARLNRAVLEYDYGNRGDALAEFDTFIDLYNSANALSAQDLMAVATAVSYLGITNKDLYGDALRAFDEAERADPSILEAPLALGLLFLERYDGTSADTEIRRALARNPTHPRALVANARAMQFNGSMGVMETVDKALEINPNLVEAKVFKAWLHLSAANYEGAEEALSEALEINPASLEALSIRAASYFLRGRMADYERVRALVERLAPGYPELYNDVSELAVNHRKYREAAELAARAVEIDSRSWRGLTLLGQNQLRLGLIEEGKASLERAYEGDPFNPWVVNTLRLVDSFEHFGSVESDKFVLVLHNREDELLRPYIEEIAEEAFTALQARYGGYTPPLPIRIEVYPDKADFSVRTLGLPGIGALGVSFGSVIAMDSPAAMRLGDFNWASVLWHEMAHVFHLGMTDHEVPRWFSEGLAVHEQHAARAGWGHQPSPGLLSRYNAGLFLPASRLDAGFVRPSYPEQVVDSYFLASIVFEFIEGRWGFDPILSMLNGYRGGKETAQLIEELLGLEAEDFDEEFDEYFRNKFRSALGAIRPAADATERILPRSPIQAAVEEPGSFSARMSAGVEAFEGGDLDEAEEQFRAALRLFPQYGGPASPYWYLALIHEGQGDLERAARALARLNALNESNYEARLKQSELLERIGDVEGAAAALENAVFIYPYEFELHEKLARLQAELGQHRGAVRERKAILALDPVDKADAFYELAKAQQAAGLLGDARRSVMSALEIAPSFDAALELLLELRSGTEGQR